MSPKSDDMQMSFADSMNVPVRLGVSDFVASMNQTLEYAYPMVEIEGEVAEFKVNQGKFVFFNLKDDSSSVGCFMMLFQLRVPIEDGMKVIVTATPKLTAWGKFSLTVKSIRPSGEGSIKKSFEMLKAKLDAEGLFAPERKRALPAVPRHVAVISSTQAAGYADFIKILNDRWGGLVVDVASVTVQGADAPDQIIRALEYFNTLEELPEVVIIIRGGGSADDLAAFNDEKLVRAVASSRIPTLTGIGHEVDTSLCDLASDVRAATPSNAAQVLVPSRHDVIRQTRMMVAGCVPKIMGVVDGLKYQIEGRVEDAVERIEREQQKHRDHLEHVRQVLAQLDPERVLARGYALVRGELKPGKVFELETAKAIIKAKVESYDKK